MAQTAVEERFFNCLRSFTERVRSLRSDGEWELTVSNAERGALTAIVRVVHRDSNDEESHELRHRPTSGWFIHTHSQCGKAAPVVRRLRSIDALEAHLSTPEALGELYGAHPASIAMHLNSCIHRVQRVHRTMYASEEWAFVVDRGVPFHHLNGRYPLLASDARRESDGEHSRIEVGFDNERWCFVYRHVLNGKHQLFERRCYSVSALYNSIAGTTDI
jgi:hypothetical protein